jgi:eukaryotic-like serine/threonine-protein kinase
MSHSLEALLIGRTLLDRYVVDEVIGRGGMSIVYRARDQRLGRPIALKIVSLPAHDEQQRISLRERFRREAGSAARIPPHPNVVQVYDYGTDPELDLDFIVMELLVGRDLKAAIRRGDLHDAEALRVMREAARGDRGGAPRRDRAPRREAGQRLPHRGRSRSSRSRSSTSASPRHRRWSTRRT